MTENISIKRAVDITSSFEGSDGYSTLSGNHDGQGMSFGFLQFAARQGSLYTLLKQCLLHMPATMKTIFDVQPYPKFQELKDALQTHQKFIAFAEAISTSTGKTLNEPWRRYFRELGRAPGCQYLQRIMAKQYIDNARRIMQAYKFRSERAFALCFDIAVQNGSVVLKARDIYRQETRDYMSERTKLFILARAVALASRPEYVDDVMSRKMAIVSGSGFVHGRTRYLEIDDKEFAG